MRDAKDGAVLLVRHQQCAVGHLHDIDGPAQKASVAPSRKPVMNGVMVALPPVTFAVTTS
jgi:hypothetical protein